MFLLLEQNINHKTFIQLLDNIYKIFQIKLLKLIIFCSEV